MYIRGVPRRVIDTIDPAGAARRAGADGSGIVVAVIASGIDGRHPHFEANGNLILPKGLQHYDLTLIRSEEISEGWLPRYGERLSQHALGAALETLDLDRDLHNAEALIDRNGFGTHVAAVIGGQFDPSAGVAEAQIDEPISGVAPKCKLLSLKVLDDQGLGTEYDILRALQLVLAHNAVRPKSVHIVLIPLSIAHDVENYACGRSPVCEAIQWLVESGVVVVVSSGNRGYQRLNAGQSEVEVGSLMNITDPGNAECAITVGATHRFFPLEYGASYFSGRGPTLDGRNKPDLLAPGEKILSAVPSPQAKPTTGKGKRKRQPAGKRFAAYEVKDGTSGAAAYVAGAVAVLLSARADLVGQAETVKDLLRSTATDLGRHVWVQGRGLLNLSRALGTDVGIESKPANAEGARPAITAAPAKIEVSETLESAPAATRPGGKRFAVALSFSGKDRDFVQKVVYALRNELARPDIFYDKYYQSELTRLDLDIYLQDLYAKQAELVVVFLSEGYEKADWCGLEWRAVRALIKRRAGHAVMPISLDDTTIAGLLSIDSPFSAKNKDPELIADLILERLRHNRAGGLT